MTNNKKILQILNGYLKLNSDERSIFNQELNSYNRSGFTDKSNIEKSISSKLSQDLGPTDDKHCPCCGKS